MEGTQVFGVFLDAHCQQPLILVTLGGASTEVADPGSGFNDPSGTYPLADLIGQPDVSRLADERAEEHPSLVLKRTTRTQDVPVAQKHEIDAEGGLGALSDILGLFGIDAGGGGNDKWSEPNSRYGSKDAWKNKGREFLAEVASVYPMNHVVESESGHVFEVDDTPGAERLHRFHRSGTFEEIQHDGTTIRKIVGDDFEVAARNKNVVIRGDCNITVNGNVTLKAKSVTQEVEEDYYLSIGGDFITKVGGNMGTEVAVDRSIRTGRDDYVKIEGDSSTVVAKNDARSTGGNDTKTVGGNRSAKIGGLAGALFGGVSDTLTVAGDIWTGADGNMTDVVGAAKATTVGKSETTDIVANKTDTIGGNAILNVDGAKTTTVLGSAVDTFASMVRTVASTTLLLGGKIRHNGFNIGFNHKHTKVKTGPSISGIPLP